MSTLTTDTPASTPKLDALAQRMREFTPRECFDGYPSMTCLDEALIADAIREYRQQPEGWDPYLEDNIILTLSYLASEFATQPAETANCARFVMACAQNILTCNLTEGDAPGYPEIAFSVTEGIEEITFLEDVEEE